MVRLLKQDYQNSNPLSLLYMGELAESCEKQLGSFELQVLPLDSLIDSKKLPSHDGIILFESAGFSPREFDYSLLKNCNGPILVIVGSLNHSWLSVLKSGAFMVLDKESANLDFEIHQTIHQHRKQVDLAQRESDQDLFYARLMHDLRSPLNTIVGVVDLVSGGQSELTVDLKSALDRSSKFMLKLVNNSLELAKVSAEEITLKVSEYSVEQVVNDIEHIFCPKIIEKQIDFVRSVSGFAEGQEFVGDGDRVSQVIMNLVSNAIKFTSKGGQVVVDVAHDKQGNGDYCVLKVKDNGIGIAERKLEKIFDDYKQAEDGDTQKNYGGTGLGLGIVRNILHAMGGRISAESKVGEGTTFTCRWPVKFNIKQTPRVLLINDDDQNDKYMEMSLEDKGFEVLRSKLLGDESFVEHGDVDFVVADVSTVEQGAQISSLDQLKLENRQTPVAVLVSQDETSPNSPKFDNEGVRAFRKQDNYILPLVEHINRVTQEKTSTKAIENKKYKILVVEDSDDNKLMLKAFFKKTNYQISYTSNGQEGLQACVTGEFDLVLMDIFMPIMDGTDAIVYIQKHYKEVNQDLPYIVAMTSCVRQADLLRFENLGFNDHLAKPLTKKSLFTVIEKFSELA